MVEVSASSCNCGTAEFLLPSLAANRPTLGRLPLEGMHSYNHSDMACWPRKREKEKVSAAAEA